MSQRDDELMLQDGGATSYCQPSGKTSQENSIGGLLPSNGCLPVVAREKVLDHGCVRRYRRLNLVGRIDWSIHANWANWTNLPGLPNLPNLPNLGPLPTLTYLSNLTVCVDGSAFARDVTRLIAFIAYFSN